MYKSVFIDLRQNMTLYNLIVSRKTLLPSRNITKRYAQFDKHEDGSTDENCFMRFLVVLYSLGDQK